MWRCARKHPRRPLGTSRGAIGGQDLPDHLDDAGGPTAQTAMDRPVRSTTPSDDATTHRLYLHRGEPKHHREPTRLRPTRDSVAGLNPAHAAIVRAATSIPFFVRGPGADHRSHLPRPADHPRRRRRAWPVGGRYRSPRCPSMRIRPRRSRNFGRDGVMRCGDSGPGCVAQLWAPPSPAAKAMAARQPAAKSRSCSIPRPRTSQPGSPFDFRCPPTRAMASSTSRQVG